MKQWKLFPFQQEAVNISSKHKKFGLFAKMGLGKTIMALELSKSKDKVIIVCPSSIILQWVEKLEGENYLILDKGKDKDIKNILDKNPKYIIATYDTIVGRFSNKPKDKLLPLNDYFVIFDEAHNLSGYNSKRSKWAIENTKNSEILLLTGTPQSKYHHLFNLAILLGFPYTYKQLMSTYCHVWKMGSGYAVREVIVGYRNIDHLINMMKQRSSWLTREDAGIQLPDKIIQNVILNHDNYKVYEDIVKKNLDYKGIYAKNEGNKYLLSREIANGFIQSSMDGYKYQIDDLSKHKIKALQDIIDSSDDEPLIVFYNFNKEHEQIKELCNKNEIKLLSINGQVKEQYERHKIKGKYILAINYASGAEAIDLPDIRYMVYYSPTLRYIWYTQSQDRINRIGQKHTCYYYKFITKNTVEENIYKNLQEGKDSEDYLFSKDNDWR